MNKSISLSFVIGLIVVSCTDPNVIGLEVHPPSDNIIITSERLEGIISNTESEDSLRSDDLLTLILGNISEDPVFLDNSAGFYTQILLTENNTDLGTNPIVDSVVLSYTYSGYYGKDLEELTTIKIRRLTQPIYKDSIYYSNFSYSDNGEVLSFPSPTLNLDELNPFLRVNLDVDFIQDLFNLGNEV